MALSLQRSPATTNVIESPKYLARSPASSNLKWITFEVEQTKLPQQELPTVSGSCAAIESDSSSWDFPIVHTKRPTYSGNQKPQTDKERKLDKHAVVVYKWYCVPNNINSIDANFQLTSEYQLAADKRDESLYEILKDCKLFEGTYIDFIKVDKRVLLDECIMRTHGCY